MKTYEIVIKEEEDYKIKGNSRIGGLPDLPLEINYPIGKRRPMEFLIQINLQLRNSLVLKIYTWDFFVFKGIIMCFEF